MRDITWKDVGFWTRKARETLGMSQVEAAKKLGVSKSSLSLIESGQRGVDSLMLARLAALYEQPLSHFLRLAEEAGEPEVIRFLLRGEVVTKQDRPLIQRFLNYSREYAFLEKIVFQEVRFDIPFYSDVGRYPHPVPQGQHVAKKERKRLKLGNAPIRDIFELLEKQGVKVFRWKFPKDSKIAGCFFFRKDIGPSILVNMFHPFRANFSAAHEHCHVLADLRDMKSHVSELSEPEISKPNFEVRADAFAAAFLMPSEGIKEFFEFDLGVKKGDQLSVEDIIHVQRYFGVSYQAMLWRLYNLKWLSKQDLQEFQNYRPTLEAKRLGYNEEVPYEEEISFPRRFTHLAIEAFRKQEISSGKLSELLNIPRNKLSSLLNSWGVRKPEPSESVKELREEVEKF